MRSGSIRTAIASDVGLRRRNNQDSGIARRGVYVVCDGMGGGMGGERASRLAVERLARLADQPERGRDDIDNALAEAQHDILALGLELGGVAGTTISGLILPTVPSEASSPSKMSIPSEATSPSKETATATPTSTNTRAETSTATATTANPEPAKASREFIDQAYVVNIGDSRTYHMNPLPRTDADAEPTTTDDGLTDVTPLWDATSLTRITRDHSQRQEAIDSGRMLPEVAEATIPRNIITQCLGDPNGIKPDVYVADMVGRFIVCSDGLHGEVPDDRIAAIAAAHANPQEAVDALLAAALNAGGTDNITVIVVDMPPVSPKHHAFSAYRLNVGEEIGVIEDSTLQTLRTLRSA
ncbi:MULTISPECIES: PP2C family serine/threonine-protein phosphatase [Bifidobacterium]|uniref:Protein phosphatase n=1 Tax=Bifidobacterium myosotis TaxID=1630166 RepID=A0A261FPC0_9BIFI|nr:MULTISPECIES: PP2C family serine/threonine-protein phosphatase [Bifidobacterium]OZG60813.1 protein phosphatase [Bifidobacterium myosotis]TPF92979.1 protein phosphatase [Bifidobacterium sp. UTBIF-78]